jgi:hypothetical protein
MKQGGKQTTTGRGHPMHVAIMARVTQERKFVGWKKYFFVFETHLLFVLCSLWALIGYGGNKRETEEEKADKVVSPPPRKFAIWYEASCGPKEKKEQQARVKSETRPTATTIVKQVFFLLPGFSELQPSFACICGRRKLCLR